MKLRNTLRWFAALVLAGCSVAQAQTWPDKPIRLLVPWAPGGATDMQARLIAPGLEKALGQPVVIDNKAGASGSIGTAMAAQAAPDGYTVLMGSIGPNAVSGALVPGLAYDPGRDFVPVALTGISPNVLVVHPSFPAQTLPELIAMAKKQPGKLDYASPGNGTSNHLAMELLKLRAGVHVVTLTYRGAGPAMNDVLGGQVPMMFNNIDVVLPHIRAGKLKALAITGASRSPLLPAVPTVEEAGLRDFAVGGWFGLFVPAGTSTSIVARLHDETQKVLQSPSLQQQFETKGVIPGQMKQAEFADFVKQEIGKWTEVVRDAGIRPE